MPLNVIRLSEKAILPTRAHSDDAGLDLYSTHDCQIFPAQAAEIHTDLKILLPQYTPCYGRIASRSGLFRKHGIVAFNGVIDRSYTGPLIVFLYNFSQQKYEVKAGSRVAQLIVEKIFLLPVKEVSEFNIETERCESGFGSSGY